MRLLGEVIKKHNGTIRDVQDPDGISPMLLTTHPKLKPIREKIEAGQRLSFDDGMLLYDPDIARPMMARAARRLRLRASRGASVATTTMQEPSGE